MELKNASGQYVLPDDPRLETIYKDIAEHHKTLVAHLAEPDVAWGASDPKAPYAGYYRSNPQWDMSKRPDVPRKRAIIDARNHLLAMNPDLVVVGAHLGSMEGDLDQITHFASGNIKPWSIRLLAWRVSRSSRVRKCWLFS